jgi:NAD(P)-dependent dehydrogenase (short-subunit alcohol dehydrogenase family)
VVNNAASVDITNSGRDAPAAELSDDVLEEALSVNLRGPFWYARYAIPEMLKVGGGAFVNMSSLAAGTGR